ncbi:hypothetical protein MD484_g3037, partial [Candolleomyces efflorescens]
MDVSASDPQVLRSPIALKSSLPAVLASSSSSFPSSSPSPSPTRPSSPSLDNIDMPSSIVSFGLVAPDVTQAFRLHTYEDFVRITSIERQVCSNYVCCGVHLVDFHALINHFEEKHVSVVAPNGKRIYPPERLKPAIPPPPPSPASLNSNPPPPLSPSSSRSSSVVSSPPNTPQTPANLPLGFSAPAVPVAPPPVVEYNPYMGLALSVPPSTVPPNQRFQECTDVISAFGPEYDFSKDYACYEQAYTERIHRLHEREEREREERERERVKVERQQQLTPSSSSSSCSSGFSPQEEEEAMVDDSNSVPSSQSPSISQPVITSSSSTTTTKKTAKGSQKARSETPAGEGSGGASNNGGKVVKPKLKIASTSNGAGGGNPISAGGRKREKMFKCPHQGCTKSYLNPNGLKYHLEKGTCKFDDPVNGATSASGSSSSATSSDASASESPTTESASMSTPPPPPSAVSPSPPSSSSHPHPPPPPQSSEQPPISSLPVPLNPSTSYAYQYASSPIYPTLVASSSAVPLPPSTLLQFHPTPGLVAPIARYPAFRSTPALMMSQHAHTPQPQAPSRSNCNTDRLSDGPDPDHDGTGPNPNDRDESCLAAGTTTAASNFVGVSASTSAAGCSTTSVPGPDHLPIVVVVDRSSVQGDAARSVEATQMQAQSRFMHVMRGHGQVSSSL